VSEPQFKRNPLNWSEANREEKPNTPERKGETMKSIDMLVDAGLKTEKLRVATQVRRTHLGLRGREDKLTDELLDRVGDLEKWIDDTIAELIQAHPAYPWFSRVRGVGRENIAKVIGQIDIEKADTISALWKFCGYSVDNGYAPKRIKGDTLHYNSNLRSMCWRLGSSLLRAKGRFYEYYLVEKDKYVQRYQGQGMSIVPATSLPKVNGKKQETDTIISEGHVHNRALRKMIKLFLACLWLIWRQVEGLPVTKPYVIDKLGHDGFIDPWKMVDKEEEF